jgi:hypothetical protein
VLHGGGPHGERATVEEGAVVEEHASRVGAAAAGRGGDGFGRCTAAGPGDAAAAGSRAQGLRGEER